MLNYQRLQFPLRLSTKELSYKKKLNRMRFSTLHYCRNNNIFNLEYLEIRECVILKPVPGVGVRWMRCLGGGGGGGGICNLANNSAE